MSATPREALRAKLRNCAASWEQARYGDQGLRLRAEATVGLLREAAALLASDASPQPNCHCVEVLGRCVLCDAQASAPPPEEPTD